MHSLPKILLAIEFLIDKKALLHFLLKFIVPPHLLDAFLSGKMLNCVCVNVFFRKFGPGSRAFTVYGQYLRFFARKGDVSSECCLCACCRSE